MRTLIIQNISAMLWSAWRRRYMIAVPILVVPILALFIGALSKKTYTSHTTVLIQEAAKQNPFLQDFAVATNLKSRMDALNALLHSRHILAQVAREQKFITDATTRQNREAIIARLSRALTARLIGDDLVKITLTMSEPEGMRELLAAVSRRFVERVVAPQRSAIVKSEAFLRAELKKHRNLLHRTEQDLADYKTRFAGELPNLHASKVSRLTEVRETLAARRITLDGARAARSSLRQRLGQTNPVLGRLEEVIAKSVSDLAILRARYSDKHTRIQADLRKLQSYRRERKRALRAARNLSADDMARLWHRASTQVSNGDTQILPLLVSQLKTFQDSESLVKRLEKEVAALEIEKSDLEARVSAFGEHERRLQTLRRKIDVKRKIFNELADRHQKVQVTWALSLSEENERVKVIDPPFTPAAPSNLPLLIYLVSGVFGGIALGVGLAVTTEIIDTTIWRRDILTNLIEAPVLARIPVLRNDGFSVERDAVDFSFLEAEQIKNAPYS